jgi:hypothetical protein
MKKLLLVSTLMVIGVSGALAQGTVAFDNRAAQFPDGTTVDRFVYSDVIGGTKLVGTNFVAQLWFGIGLDLAADALTQTATGGTAPATSAPGAARFRTPTTTLPGTWSQGTRTLPGTDINNPATKSVTMQVRVWDLAAAATFADAKAQGARYGESAPFNYTLMVSTPPSPTDTLMLNLRAFALVPEPSSIALGVLGIGALVLFRRRKN